MGLSFRLILYGQLVAIVVVVTLFSTVFILSSDSGNKMVIRSSGKRKVHSGRQFCVSHTNLLEKHNRSTGCSFQHLIIQCENSHLKYLDDPRVLDICGMPRGNESNPNVVVTDGYVYNKLLPDACRRPPVLLSSSTRPPKQNGSKAVNTVVPNIVHYVSVGCKRTFTFVHHLSVLSVEKFIMPDRIYFHGDCPPRGQWWNQTLEKVPNIYFKWHPRPRLIQGRKPMWVEHETDVLRIQILLEEGGIYLDTDILVVNPITDLLKYPVSMGRERYEKKDWLGSSFIVAAPRTPFMCVWLHAFREYNPRGEPDWGRWAVHEPGAISTRFPKSVHVENIRFHRPNWAELKYLYRGFYDWSDNYVLHLWSRLAPRDRLPSSPDSIPSRDRITCTLHEVARYIYYGGKKEVLAKFHGKKYLSKSGLPYTKKKTAR